ncbi:KIF-binding protein-like [Odontomachus brunneus]|uniref:KIF-binding protein-like n=1 Tax=Odontomachus brunneus TaxID=486640 RepID=UPI0013F19EC5|nr:KIF-binding protein-like [Odontomachus brunneus]
MSTESINISECDSLESAPLAKSESAESIKNGDGVTIDCSEKIIELCCNIREMEIIISSDKDMSRTNVDTIVRYEELLDSYFFEISSSKDQKLDDIIVLAISFMGMSKIKLPFDMTEQEHLHIARYFVLQSLTLLKGKELNSRVILTAISALNLMSDICIKLRNEELSLQYLNKALDLYIAYTKGQDDFPAPINMLNVPNINTTPTNNVYLLDEIFMKTLRFLITLGCSIKDLAIDMQKMTTYMHKLLKKHLENIPQSIDYISWTTEAIRLAGYFSSCDRFAECKNHLSFASIIATKFYNNCCKIDPKTSTEENKTFYCHYKSIVSVIDVSWVKYGLALLFSSRKRLLNQEGQDNIVEINRCKSESVTVSVAQQSTKQSTELLMFPCTEKEYEKFIHITGENYITTYTEAKEIFVNILQLINKIKVDKLVSEDTEVRVEIAQYISRAYKYLAFYVDDKVNHVKLQKRRIDVLEECLTSLNEKEHTIMYVLIRLELAFINSTILNIKLESTKKNKTSEKESKKESEEINQLIEKNKTYLQFYIDNTKGIENALKSRLIDESYQVISSLNVQYSLR